ncbi:MAG: hypothetical protein RB191_08855 [Terriglobia bacterium]|nr:hypothetical protein [Terriglobia bacterium]
MTIMEFVAVTRAKKTGRGKWIAKCPAHGDRHPSLSIAEGRKGILIKCMSNGCDTRSVLDALGLGWDALFPGSRLTAAEVKRITEAESRLAREREHDTWMRRTALSKAVMWQEVANRVGGLLMKHPGSDRLAAQFNLALKSQRHFEAIADALDYPWIRGQGLPRRRTPLTSKETGAKIAWTLQLPK